MKTFSIQVNSELDSEYIQKLAFKAGYLWRCDKEPKVFKNHDDVLVFNYNNPLQITHCHIPLDNNNYSFPSQAEEIVKLFEKEKEPEFKVGDWVVNNNQPEKYIGKVHKIEECYVYYDGFDHCKAVRHATPSEIESHLIKEAEKKGFVVGAKAFSAFEGNEFECNGTFSFQALNNKGSKNILWNGIGSNRCGWVYWDGKWATLKPSHPQIIVNGFTAKFEDWGLDFNGGCAKIDKELFLSIIKNLDVKGEGNKSITSVKIGDGEFTASQIKEIADYYNSL